MKQWLSAFLLVSCFFITPLQAVQQQERQIDEQAIATFKNDPDFNYSQDYVPANSFFGLLIAYILNKLQGLFHVFEIPGLELLFRLLLVAGIIFIIVLILRMKFGPALSPTSKKFSGLPVTVFEKKGQDYKRLLEESIANQQFKLAVRYLFLFVLGSLEEQRSIQITKWKAPYDYLKELPEEKKVPFKQLADLFESTWYGDYLPNKDAVDEGLKLYESVTGNFPTKHS